MRQDATHARGEWIPTPDQVKVLEAAKECGFGKTISSIAIQAGVSRQTIHRWLKDDLDFIEAWTEIPKQILRSGLPGVYAALKQKATGGDVAAIKLYLELSGDYVPPAQRIDATVTVTIADELKKARERAATKR